jgi:hypothetical protein
MAMAGVEKRFQIARGGGKLRKRNGVRVQAAMEQRMQASKVQTLDRSHQIECLAFRWNGTDVESPQQVR